VLIVIPSVGYADFLAVTLPAWRAFAPHATVRVVTSVEDRATFDLASAAEVGVVVTDSWHAGGAAFNKARALDDAIPPQVVQWCLVVDADVWPVGRMPDLDTLSRVTLYGCPRRQCDTPATLEAVRCGRVAVEDLPLILPRRFGQAAPQLLQRPSAEDERRVGRAGLGYFQLFRHLPGMAFGHSETAGGYDQRFAGKFGLRASLPGVSVLHLGAQDRRNWSGRVVPAWGDE
jgi:hypothetical protein